MKVVSSTEMSYIFKINEKRLAFIAPIYFIR